MGRLFGTDGVRGVANKELTPELAFKLGKAGAYVLKKENDKPVVIIGKDTRISGDMLENALKRFPGTIVLISHDEHLVRAVANRVVDIRDGKMTVYDGDYEYYLFKREDLAQRAAAEQTAAQPSRNPQEKHEQGRTLRRTHEVKGASEGGKKTREQRRAEAEARAALNKRLKKTKDRLKTVETQLEQKRERYDGLMELMASEELYADQEKFSAALAEYNSLKQEIPALEDEWLELSTTIEEETARGLS